MARPPPQSFLLRLWREQADAPLRATLISVTQPAEQRHFATLEALHAFLRTQADPTAEECRSPVNCTRSETSDECEAIIADRERGCNPSLRPASEAKQKEEERR
jgi:hypothetical protein